MRLSLAFAFSFLAGSAYGTEQSVVPFFGSFAVSGEIRDEFVSRDLKHLLEIEVAGCSEPDKPNCDDIIYFSIGEDAVLGDRVNPDYISNLSMQKLAPLRTRAIKNSSCHIDRFTNKDGQIFLWIVSDLSGQEIADVSRCMFLGLAVSLDVSATKFSEIPYLKQKRTLEEVLLEH